jgi:hypothetical protein
LHTSSQAQHQVQSGLLLNIVIGKSPTILQLLPSKDQTLLIRRNSFLILDLHLNIVDGIRALHLKRDGLARQSLHKDLHDENLIFQDRKKERKKQHTSNPTTEEIATTTELVSNEPKFEPNFDQSSLSEIEREGEMQ